MDRQQIGTKLVMKALGLDLSMLSFEDRLILQKTVYLAQGKGVGLGYQFHWYLRGPYSRALSSDGFSIVSETSSGEDESAGWQLSSPTQKKLEELRELIFSPEPEALDRRLELLASVHFLVSRKQVSRDVDKLKRTLAKFEKHYSEDQVGLALRDLERHGLLKASRKNCS